MICLNQQFYILTDMATLPKKLSQCSCRNLINLNYHTLDDNKKLVCFRSKETAEIHRLRSDELTKNYRVNKVDSRDIVQILDCFDLECELK